MNLISKLNGINARKDAAAKPPFGGGFSAEIVARTETLEVHGTGVGEPGHEFCEFRAFDAKGVLLGTKRVKGY